MVTVAHGSMTIVVVNRSQLKLIITYLVTITVIRIFVRFALSITSGNLRVKVEMRDRRSSVNVARKSVILD
jgi:hypothetical protein